MSERTCLLPNELPTCLPAYLSVQLSSKTANQRAAWLRSELASQQTRRPANVTESSTSVQRSRRSAAENAVWPEPINRLIQDVDASQRQGAFQCQTGTFVDHSAEFQAWAYVACELVQELDGVDEPWATCNS